MDTGRNCYMHLQKNESNRTEFKSEVLDRRNKANKFGSNRIDVNQTRALRIIDKTDTMSNISSYANRQSKNNKQHLLETMNGMEDLGQLVHLQVKGNSQILKEIRETQGLETKLIDREALYRNEMTRELD